VSVEWVRGYSGKEEGKAREVVEQKDKEIQQQERFERIQKWNRWYKEIGTMGTLRYLREKWKEERMIRVRFRLGNEMREGKYWEDEEKRRCRICGWEEETWEDVMEVCMREGEEGEERKYKDTKRQWKWRRVDEKAAGEERQGGVEGGKGGGRGRYGKTDGRQTERNE